MSTRASSNVIQFEYAVDDTRARGRRVTASSIEALKPRAKRYEVTDPAIAGLQLRVAPTGVKSWIFRYYWRGARQRLVLGPWPNISLAQAREMTSTAHQLIRRGIDPRSAGLVLRRAPTPTAPLPVSVRENPHSVATLVDEYMRLHVRPRYKDPQAVLDILELDVLPEWGARDARTIKPREVIELLDRIVARGAKVKANRTASLLGQMFRFGIHRSIVETSPVQLLYRPGGREKSRSRALSEDELRAFVQKRHEACRFRKMAHVLMILLLTLQRRSELGLAAWSEFDLEKKTWTIPAEHSKNGRGHVLPLTDWTIEEFRGLKELAGASRFVLPNTSGAAPDDPKYMTRSVAKLQKRFRKIGVDQFTAHDLRRTGRTGLGRLGVPRDIAERVLNHTLDKLDATYDVYDYAREKRDALEKWAAYLANLATDG